MTCSARSRPRPPRHFARSGHGMACAAAAAVAACVLTSLGVALPFLQSTLQGTLRPGSRGHRGRSHSVRAVAEGFFPGQALAEDFGPSRGALLERLEPAIPGDQGVEEHTEETRLLRDQTALLSQELRLLREVLQDGSLRAALAARASIGSATQERAPAASAAAAPTAPGPKLSFNEVMAMRAAGEVGHRRPEALEALAYLSQRVVARRIAGELPLGQVPNMS
eukprot:gb/GFBE01037738.1/.p1 GENE.gb/GFBE01037738.1/~~gb/GFBE01037738.1/.p1  ORF type:complete len:223 (+),score=35.35 gb/GFBE01037738.1/:1-669(+)